MVARLRQAAIARLTGWSARRHGLDRLPLTVNRRRIYIVPTRFGIALALLLAAMLLAGLNYNSNLGLAFGFLMTSLVLVAMHHCHRNLLNLRVDVAAEVDAFAGAQANFEFVLYNDAAIERCEIQILCGEAAATGPALPPRSHRTVTVALPVPRRGVVRLQRFELRTRHPFGWFRAWTYVHCPLIAWVAPQPRGDRILPAAAGGAGATARTDLRGEEEFSELRAYEAGVSLKHMAWKVLARGGEPVVRSYSSETAQPEWLDWSSLGRLDAEARLSQLCRWVLDSEAAQRNFGMRIPGVEIMPSRGTAHRAACLRALARYPAARP